MMTMQSNNQVVKDPPRPAKPRRAKFRAESGQSLLEVAFLTPFLLLLCLGAIEIGRFAYMAIRVGSAARAGVAYGAQTHWTAGDATGITTAACQDFQGTNTCSPPLTVTKAFLCQCDNAGTIGPATAPCNCPQGSNPVVSLQVTASGTFNALFNYPGVPSSLTITRTATMRLWQ